MTHGANPPNAWLKTGPSNKKPLPMIEASGVTTARQRVKWATRGSTKTTPTASVVNAMIKSNVMRVYTKDHFTNGAHRGDTGEAFDAEP